MGVLKYIVRGTNVHVNVESCLRKKYSRRNPETIFGAPVRELMRPRFHLWFNVV